MVSATTDRTGRIYVLRRLAERQSVIDVFDPSANLWETLTDQPLTGYANLTLGRDGWIYAISDYFYGSSSVKAFNPVTRRWHVLADMPFTSVYGVVSEPDSTLRAFSNTEMLTLK